VAHRGRLELFSNVDEHGQWLARPNTILVDSEQLESGEAMSPEFKRIAGREIEEFKADYRARFPGADVERLTDEDLLREVLNTVGKPGRLGEHVRCVVSVAMLSEGWDANTVTHILGVRAFGTQLLCEQVVGRALRRTSYATERRTVGVGARAEEVDCCPPEYAEVYGVPFSFMPCASAAAPVTTKPTTRVYALPERAACEMTFPRVTGYRWELSGERLSAAFSDESTMVVPTPEVPLQTEMSSIIGEAVFHDLDELRVHREQEVAFHLARRVLERYLRDAEDRVQPWLFPEVLQVTRRWLRECLVCREDGFPQLLLFVEYANRAGELIARAIAAAEAKEKRLLPVLEAYDATGSTKHVDFTTTKPSYRTRQDKCHVNYVVGDTDDWEQKMARVLEGIEEVECYVKNEGLGFAIPYTVNDEERSYYPDFIVRVREGGGHAGPPLHIVVEVSGASRVDKQAKVDTARNLWVPAINNHGGFGRWAFVEITDPWADAALEIRAAVPE
jgi:type III restriction enzyme